MTKKKQSNTCSLQTFLAVTTPTTGSWVDESHELPTAPMGRDRQQIQAPREDRRAPSVSAPRHFKDAPKDPPYTVFVGQLPYDLDCEGLGLLFYNRGCLIKDNIRIVKDLNNKSKGFGYVEFMDRESMIKALEMDGYSVKRRSIRVDVAAEKKDNQSRPYMDRSSMSGNRNQYNNKQRSPMDDSNLSASSWRSEKSESDSPSERPASSADSSSFSRERPAIQRDIMQRRSEGDTLNSRSGSGSRDRSHSQKRGGGDYGHSNHSMTSPRRYNQDHHQFRRGRQSSHGGDENQMGSRSYRREDHANADDRATRAPTGQRPKLALAPRTVPLLTTDSAQTSMTPTPTSTTSSLKPNPFGAARPVDTTQVMKKVEEKLEALKVVTQTTAPTSPTSTKTSSPQSPRRRPSSKSARSRSRSQTKKKEIQASPDSESHASTSLSPPENSNELDIKA